MQHDHVLKILNFDLLTPRVKEGEGGGVCRQIICYHVATFRESPCSEKVEFIPIDC